MSFDSTIPPVIKAVDIPNDDGSAEVEGHGFKIPSPLTENDAPESDAPEGEVAGHSMSAKAVDTPDDEAEVEGHAVRVFGTTH